MSDHPLSGPSGHLDHPGHGPSSGWQQDQSYGYGTATGTAYAYDGSQEYAAPYGTATGYADTTGYADGGAYGYSTQYGQQGNYGEYPQYAGYPDQGSSAPIAEHTDYGAFPQAGYVADGYGTDLSAQSGWTGTDYSASYSAASGDATHTMDFPAGGFGADAGFDEAFGGVPEPGSAPDPGTVADADTLTDFDASAAFDDGGPDADTTDASPEEPQDAPDEPVDVTPPPAARRGRRRATVRPRARSALLTVAAPSLCVLGVTAVATAATVSDTTGTTADPAPVAAPDPSDVEPVAANAEFDTQLAGLTAAVDDYTERAGRTQERIDLQEQQEQQEREDEEERQRIEEERQKFFLPVAQHGLSAYYGQAGVNWMSLHTGIDFPVSYGTEVMAATDGTISTQWHPSYGNMVVLTAADGTETWYCHLDSAVYQSGWVQAGTVIAYSGNSGNSTGPHLHFEVRPGGGSAVDPLPWLRAQGLEPT
ncbi:peptidoglycan DD-metalloendopeptidase family protein [Streptomyces sp. RFCAC02]|uniref:peptidoglycan DD-metalloendopeptidase family protein n=1 Tax=Streptomyces sp. RFCAC02 TaxID=2499143 RepID=UPI001F0F9D22|nr:peptidoglycan DD-metalloendopeptidase family protein [Streptomyces sp. RFCAC02]